MDDVELTDIWPAERRRDPKVDPPICPAVHGAPGVRFRTS
jgi:hypothetical protein